MEFPTGFRTSFSEHLPQLGTVTLETYGHPQTQTEFSKNSLLAVLVV